MAHQRTLEDIWGRFIELLAAQSPQMIESIRPPAALEVLVEAERQLGCALPRALGQLYALADGFAAGAFLLREEYRLLPLSEMVETSKALVGEPVVPDALAGEVTVSKKVIRLVFVQTKEDDPDVLQVSLRLWPKKQASVELWYREGGIHDFEEIVDSDEDLSAWIEECLEYYA